MTRLLSITVPTPFDVVIADENGEVYDPQQKHLPLIARAVLAALGEEERRELLGGNQDGARDRVTELDYQLDGAYDEARFNGAVVAECHRLLDKAMGKEPTRTLLRRLEALLTRVTEAEAARDAWKRAAERTRLHLCDALGIDRDSGADPAVDEARALREQLAGERSKRTEAEARAKELETKAQQPPLTEDQYRRFLANERNATGEWKRRAIEAESAVTSERARRERAEAALAEARDEADKACTFLYDVGATRGNVVTRAERAKETYRELIDETVEQQTAIEAIAKALGVDCGADQLPSKVAEVVRRDAEGKVADGS